MQEAIEYHAKHETFEGPYVQKRRKIRSRNLWDIGGTSQPQGCRKLTQRYRESYVKNEVLRSRGYKIQCKMRSFEQKKL